MIANLKQLARRTAAGFSGVTRRLSASRPRIIMYHGFRAAADDDPDGLPISAFRRQLEYLRRYYEPLSLRELADRLAERRTFPPRSVVLTIDDGHANFIRRALPILSEFGFPATLFVVSKLIDDAGWIWTDRFKYLRDEVNRPNDFLGTRAPETLAALKLMGVEQREASLAEMAGRAGVTIPRHPPDRYRLATWDELRAVADRGLVEIGSHTRTHPILSMLSAQPAWDEIDGSRRDIEQRLGVEVTSFCYPNGKPCDVGADQIEMVRRAGYRCAVTTSFGYVGRATDRLTLPRLGGDNPDMTMFCKYLDGLEYFQRRWTSG